MSSTDLIDKVLSTDTSIKGESTDGSPETVTALEMKEDADERPGALPLDVVFDLLKNQRRRRVLRYLEENEEATLSDIAEHIAALENEKEVEQLSSSERKRTYVGLYQCHLPRMDDAGVIEFNADRGVVKLNDRAEQLGWYLDMSRRPWPLYYAGISFVGTVLYVLSWFTLGTTLLLTVTPIAVTIAVFVCALFHYRSDARHRTL